MQKKKIEKQQSQKVTPTNKLTAAKNQKHKKMSKQLNMMMLLKKAHLPRNCKCEKIEDRNCKTCPDWR
jgi:hypothetical protein